MNRRKIMIFIMVIIALCLQIYASDGPRLRPHSWARAVVGTDLENFFQVSDKVYSSGQPTAKDLKLIEKMGIVTVLDLRGLHSDKNIGKGTKLILKQVKMDAGKIRDEDVIEALKIIEKSSGPVLVHCWHGSDRTGLIVAMYRIVVENWSKEHALDELINGGYGYHEWTYPNIREYIRKCDPDKIREKLEF